MVIDRWTDLFFWPALLGAWTGPIIAALCVTVGHPFDAMVFPATISLGALAATMFVAMLCDPWTRRSVSAFNRDAAQRWREMSWMQRFFSKEYGDFRLILVNRLAWVEIVAMILADHRPLQLISFLSFGLSTLMLILLLKRRPEMLLQKHGSPKSNPSP